MDGGNDGGRRLAQAVQAAAKILRAYLSGNLIGAAFEEEGRFVLCQYLAEDLSEEEALLSAFSERISGKKRLFHFNGTTFDVPFFQARCRKYGLPCGLPEMEQTDLYRQINPFKNALKLSSCRLKALEEFLGSHRADPFTGGQLIALYQEYRISRDERLLAAMLLHNAENLQMCAFSYKKNNRRYSRPQEKSYCNSLI